MLINVVLCWRQHALNMKQYKTATLNPTYTHPAPQRPSHNLLTHHVHSKDCAADMPPASYPFNRTSDIARTLHGPSVLRGKSTAIFSCGCMLEARGRRLLQKNNNTKSIRVGRTTEKHAQPTPQTYCWDDAHVAKHCYSTKTTSK